LHFLQIFTKLVSGEEAKKSFKIPNTEVQIDLPDHVSFLNIL
jgi:hypothetical protein